MTLTRPAFLASAVLLLAGCADNPPSRTYLAFADHLELGELRVHYAQAIESDALAPLADKVNLAENFGPGQPPCDDARMNRAPTPEESSALRHWMELRTAYYTGLAALRARADEASPQAAPAAHRYETGLLEDVRRSAALIWDLADGKITYCQFASRDKVLTYYARRREGLLRDNMVLAEPVLAPGENSIYGPSGIGIPQGPQ